jgi:hypothetical protein
LKSTSYDEAIDVVTDLREGGDVRGSPLAVIMGLVSTQGQHIPCREFQVLCPVICLLAEDSYQSREEPEVVSQSEPRTPRRFFHFSETMRDMLVREHGS